MKSGLHSTVQNKMNDMAEQNRELKAMEKVIYFWLTTKLEHDWAIWNDRKSGYYCQE